MIAPLAVQARRGGASLEVMDRDARRMRGQRPFLFTNLKEGNGVAEIVEFVAATGGLP